MIVSVNLYHECLGTAQIAVCLGTAKEQIQTQEWFKGMDIWSGYLSVSKENMPEVPNLRFSKTENLEDGFTSVFSPTLFTIYYFVTLV